MRLLRLSPSPFLCLLLLLGLAGCTGNPRTPDSETEREDEVLLQSPDSSGALWLSFPDGAHGTVWLRAYNVTAFPFAMQADWLAEGQEPTPLFSGFELDFRHQDGAASVTINGQGVASPSLSAPLPPFTAGANLELNRSGPGHLVVAWSALPEGLTIYAQPGVADAIADRTLTATEFLHLTRESDGPEIFTPVALAAAGNGQSSLGLPHLANVRLIIPTNAGEGELQISGESFQWRQAASETGNTSCIDCFQTSRFLALLDEPWTFNVRYLGRAGSFQVFLTVTEIPPAVTLGTTNHFTEHPDCLDPFAGC